MKKTLLMLALLGGAAPIAPAFAQNSASAFTGSTRFDAMSRVTGTIQPDPDGAGPRGFAAVRNTYDPAGRLTKVETGELSGWQSDTVEPNNWTGFTVSRTLDMQYDQMGRKLVERRSGGGTLHDVTQYSYDALGRLDCTAVRMDAGSFGASVLPNACAHLPAGGNGPDRITRNVYDSAGELVQVREGVGTSAEAAEATFSYTPNGKKKFVIDANGNRGEFRYDGHDRLERWVFPSATKPSAYDDTDQTTALASAGALNEADYEGYGYDANGNRTTLKTRAGQTIGYAFDALNRMTSKDAPGSAVVGYAYDLRGLQTEAKFVTSGLGIVNIFDNAGRLTSTTDSTSGTGRQLTHQYDANSNRTRITHPDGVWFGYDHDGLDRFSSLTQSGTWLMDATYDAEGRRTKLQRDRMASYWNYDGAGRLSSLAHYHTDTAGDVSFIYGYNPASQIVTSTRSNDLYAFTGLSTGDTHSTVNGLNQIAAKGGTPFESDGNGNLRTDGEATYFLDAENRMIQVTGGKSANLSYDPLGRLSSVTANGGTTTFLYDGDQLVAEYFSSGGQVPDARYVQGPGVDEPLIWYAGSTLNDRRHLAADHQGSVIAVSDINGTLMAANRYDEYGLGQDSAPFGRFGYTGQAWLPEVKAYYYKARVYRPEDGRFYQVDPIGYGDQTNLYAYVGSDAVNAIDPSGTCSTGPKGETACTENTQEIVVTGLRQVLSIGVGLSPFGVAADVGTLLTGRDAITGEKVSRGAALVGLIPGVSEARKGVNIIKFAVHIDTKIARKLASRGWTEQSVRRTIENPVRTVAVRDTRRTPGGRLNEPATRYYSPDGGYVVRNNRTGDIVQISNRNNPNWIER